MEYEGSTIEVILKPFTGWLRCLADKTSFPATKKSVTNHIGETTKGVANGGTLGTKRHLKVAELRKRQEQRLLFENMAEQPLLGVYSMIVSECGIQYVDDQGKPCYV